MVKMKKFQELLTQLLLQHSSLSHVLPALRDLVRIGQVHLMCLIVVPLSCAKKR